MNSLSNPVRQISALSATGGRFGSLFLKLIMLLFLGMSSAYANEALFTNTAPPAGADIRLQQSPTIVRSRLVALNRNSVALDDQSPSKAKNEQIFLNLFDNASFNAKLDHIESRSANNYTWFGKLADVNLGNVTLTFVDGVLAGNISMPGHTYQIRSVGKDSYAVYEIDQSKFPAEAEPLIPPQSSDTPAPDSAPAVPDPIDPTLQLPLNDVSPTAQPDTDDGSIVDMLVVYTTAAKNASTNILTEIQLAIDETNQAYVNSGISHRVRLVGTREENYTESGNISTDLNRITNSSDGIMDGVHAHRTSVRADQVTLITENGGGYCGMAWLMTTVSSSFSPNAFSVVARSCATGYYSFGHELGHNMGARHDCYVDTATTPYAYNHGYVHLGGDTANRWRTIMAYNDQCAANGYNCTRIQYFSNPNVNYNGAPTGTSIGACQANNRLAFANTSTTFSRFNDGYCDLTGYVERATVYPGTSNSYLYLRSNPLNNYYLYFTTPDNNLTKAANKALTHRTRVTLRGNQSCFYNTTDYGGQPLYLILSP